MNLWFLKRDCPENIVNQELEKVKFSQSSVRDNKRDKGVRLVARYHPLFQNIDRIFHRSIDRIFP